MTGSVADNTTLPHPKDGLRATTREAGGVLYLEMQVYSDGQPVWLEPQVILRLPESAENYARRDRWKLLWDALCRWLTLGGTVVELREIVEYIDQMLPGAGVDWKWKLWGIESECSFSYVFGDGAGHFFRWLEDEYVEPISQTDLMEGTGLEQSLEGNAAE